MQPSRRLETKFLRLPIPVTLGSRFDDWEVCWVGGWSKRRFAFVVMVVRVIAEGDRKSGGMRLQDVVATRIPAAQPA